MKKPLVIFGSDQMGELAHFYFSEDSRYEIKAFTLDAAFVSNSHFLGLPVIPFEEIERTYAPDACDMFVALGYSKVNQLRKDKYIQAKEKGYRLPSYLSPRANFLNQGKFGDNCLVLEDNTIQPFVTVGNNVTLWSGNHVGHHSTIHDHCFITSHVVISGGVDVGEACFIGVNATLRNHIKIGERSVIGAGTLILEDTAPDSLYIGAATKPAAIPSSRLKKI